MTVIFYKSKQNWKNFLKIFIYFFKILGLAENQAGHVLNLFLISDENPGWVSYKFVSYKKKCTYMHWIIYCHIVLIDFYIWVFFYDFNIKQVQSRHHSISPPLCHPSSLPACQITSRAVFWSVSTMQASSCVRAFMCIHVVCS